MDYDGSHQQRLTQYNSTSSMPAVSPDGKMFAFTTYAGGNPQIRVHSVETGRRLPFYNPVSSVVETPEFTPDGKQLLFATALNGWVQICIAGTDGGNFRRISNVRAIEVSPKVNPKTGTRHAVHFRARRPPAALAHEPRRHRYAAVHHRRGRRRQSRLESQRPADRVCLDARL